VKVGVVGVVRRGATKIRFDPRLSFDSSERINGPNAAVVLTMAEVFRDQFLDSGRAGGR